jgi:hypothetical protein
VVQQPEVFLRDLERASDEAESRLTLALTTFMAVHSEDEEDDTALLIWLSSMVPGFAVIVLDLMEKYSPAERLSEAERGRLIGQAIAVAAEAFKQAGKTDPQLLAGSGAVDRATRLRHLAISIITSVRSEIQQNSAELLGFLTKTWRTRLDQRVRTAHRLLEGRTLPIEATFHTLGGSLRFPGDPTAHPSLTINCRCELQFGTEAIRRAA